MKWWGWLVVGVATSLIWVALLLVLEALGVLDISKFNAEAVVIGGLVIIWSVCIGVPLVLKAVKGTKEK